jgi:FlaA1/EpsC-like NDP-sugar epimerase
MDPFSYYKDRKILITGGIGTVGRELVRQLLDLGAKTIRVLDINETELFFFMEKYRNNKSIRPFLGDVRDEQRLSMAMEDVQVVFHTAALKHVILCEYNPFEAVRTNILGVQNLINAVMRTPSVERVIFTSSDKAVNPSNVMGTSKLMGERLITSATDYKGARSTIFASTRFGNVLGSQGSVIPLFKSQLNKGGPITLTSKGMTRFVMPIEDAVRLVLKAGAQAKGGEIFVTKMPIMEIEKLAELMIERLAAKAGYSPSQIKIEEIGIKPGEKLYEELITDDEATRTIELKDMFVVLPAILPLTRHEGYVYDDQLPNKVTKAYKSSDVPAMSKSQMLDFLQTYKLLED